MWFLTYATEHTKLPYLEILDMQVGFLVDYIQQVSYLFPKTETTKISEVSNSKLNKFLTKGGK